MNDMQNNQVRRRKKVKWGLVVLALPGLAFLIGIYFVPLAGLVIPFKQMDYAKGIFGSPWCRPIFQNFEFFFQSSDAWNITRNTISLNFIFIFSTLFLSIVLSLFLFELSSKFVKLFQTCMFVPYFISWVVGGYIVYALLAPDIGVIPSFLQARGVTAPDFYNEPQYWPYILTASYFWKHCGYMTLLFYASLMGMDSSLFEAASIDGANKFQRVWHISIPYLLPTIILLGLLQIGKIFNADFGMFYFLPRNSGMLYSVTDVIDTYVYRTLCVTGNIGLSSAVGLFQSIVGFILVLLTNLAVRKYNKDFAVF